MILSPKNVRSYIHKISPTCPNMCLMRKKNRNGKADIEKLTRETSTLHKELEATK